MNDKQYIYAVARIRSKELNLLSKQFIDQLVSSKTYEDCLKLLADKGWGDANHSVDEMFILEKEKTWALMDELVEDRSVFRVFFYENDFHNLKAAIKDACVKADVPDIYMTDGTVDLGTIKTAINEKDFSLLPEYMRACAQEAYEVQLKTYDSQLCDVICDRACLEKIYEAGKADGGLFEGYANQKVASANINIAIRSYRTKKNVDFLKKAFVPCDIIDIDKLMAATLESEEAIYSYLETTAYADAVGEIKKSLLAFERWCDNKMIEQIRPQKYNPFSISPLAAYILARENEIKTVRILLSGKRNEMSEDSIRERIREMYV